MTTKIISDSKWLEPSTMESKESLTRVQNIIGNFDQEHTMKYYDYWSKHYEDDLKNLDYNVPNEMTDCLLRDFPEEKFSDKNTEILDIGSGTGQMAESILKSNQFNGKIDAIDGNVKMMAKALKKQIYRHHTLHFLIEDSPMPIPSNSYDAVVCCCAMVPGLIQPECLPEMVRVVKAGGTFCFTTRATDGNNEFLNRVTDQLQKMKEDGLIEIFDTRKVPQYSWPVNADVSQESKDLIKHCISAVLYGIKKLKDS